MVKSVIKLSVLLVLVFSVGAAANPISYGFSVFAYVDGGYTQDIPDEVPGLLTLYVLSGWGYMPMTAMQFSAANPDCFEAVYVGETCAHPVAIGNTQIGMSVAFGGCVTSQVVVVTINYFVQGLTGECCWYPMDKDIADPHGIPGYITYTDCSDPITVQNFRAGASLINGNGNCDSPVKASTWGQVKSLYVR